MTFVNQYTGHLFIDIVNAFADKDIECNLITGKIDPNFTPLNPKVTLYLHKPYNKKSLLKRFFSWISFTVFAFKKLLFLNKNATLFFVTNPAMVCFLGLLFKVVFKQPYVVLIYDLYPDAMVNFGYVKNKSFIHRAWSFLNQPLFEKASTVFTISTGMAQRIQHYAPKITPVIIPNWTDIQQVKPLKKSENPFAITHQQTDKLTVLYAGNMGLTHDLESVLYAAKTLRPYHHIQFLLIGEGSKKPWIEDFMKKEALDNVKLMPLQPAHVIPLSIPCGDIAIVTLGEGGEYVSVPSKVYYYMAAGCCILSIAGIHSELEQLTHEFHFGKRVNPKNETQIVDFILSMSKDPDTLEKFKANARAASLNFTKENAQKFYTTLFSSQ